MQFHDTTLGAEAMTSDQLDSIALERAGVVGSIAYGSSCCGEVGQLAGGWSARWINTQGMGNHGTLVLVATNRRTRALSKEGKIREFMAAGLARLEAELLYRANAPYKFELVGLLASVLGNKGQVQAMLNHPCSYGASSGRGEWQRAWGGVFGPEGLGISAPREAALAEMVKAVKGVA